MRNSLCGVIFFRGMDFFSGETKKFKLKNANSGLCIGVTTTLTNDNVFHISCDDTTNSVLDRGVVGYAGAFRYSNGKTGKHTYIIECDGHHYPAAHHAVAGALLDAAVKRRIKCAAPPRLL